MRTLYIFLAALVVQSTNAEAQNNCDHLVGEYITAQDKMPSDMELNGQDSTFIPSITIDKKGKNGNIRVMVKRNPLFEVDGEEYQFSSRKEVSYIAWCDNGDIVGTTIHRETEAGKPLNQIGMVVQFRTSQDPITKTITTTNVNLVLQDDITYTLDKRTTTQAQFVRLPKN